MTKYGKASIPTIVMRDKPLIIGHRGAAGYYPENTCPSFLSAFEQGCDGIEFDVQQSKDGEIVVFHDWDLERCSNGKGLLCEQSFAHLRSLDAGSWYKSHPPAQIPTLEEVLDLIPAGKLINIEVKALYSEERSGIEKIVDIICCRETKKDIVVSSFSHNLLKSLHGKAPEIRIGLLLGNTLLNLPQYIRQLDFPIFSIHPYVALLRADEVAWAQEQQIKIYPWTVNQKYQFEQCLKFGVDGIISDYPDVLRRISTQ